MNLVFHISEDGSEIDTELTCMNFCSLQATTSFVIYYTTEAQKILIKHFLFNYVSLAEYKD